MKVVEIAFVVYPVTDSKRARQFYEGTLGLAASRAFGNENAGMIEYDIGPGTLAIGFGYPGFNPSAGGEHVAASLCRGETMHAGRAAWLQWAHAG